MMKLPHGNIPVITVGAQIVSQYTVSPSFHSDGDAPAILPMNHPPFRHSIDFRSVHATSGEAGDGGEK